MIKDQAYWDKKKERIDNLFKRDLTGWNLVENKPAEIGVYQTALIYIDKKFDYTEYQYWNGEYWGGICDTPELAATKTRRDFHSPNQDRLWKEIVK